MCPVKIKSAVQCEDVLRWQTDLVEPKPMMSFSGLLEALMKWGCLRKPWVYSGSHSTGDSGWMETGDSGELGPGAGCVPAAKQTWGSCSFWRDLHGPGEEAVPCSPTAWDPRPGEVVAKETGRDPGRGQQKEAEGHVLSHSAHRVHLSVRPQVCRCSPSSPKGSRRAARAATARSRTATC